MKQVDFHGKTVEEATELFEDTINEVRLNKETREIKLVTGRGAIHKKLVELIREYQLEYAVPMANEGQINVVIE